MSNVLLQWKITNPTCSLNPGLIKDICHKPQILISDVFNPLLEWLNNYQFIKTGVIVPGSVEEIDNFLRAGLYRMYRFVMVTDFFANNPQFFIDIKDISINKGNFEKYKEIKTQQSGFSEFINLLISKLTGCKGDTTFLFLKLIKSVRNLSSELKQMETYLTDHCLVLRVKELNKY